MKNRFFIAIAQNPTHCHLLTDSSFISERKERNLHYLPFQKGCRHTEVIISIFDCYIIAVAYFMATTLLEPYLSNMNLPIFF